MHSVRGSARSLVPLACAALLAVGGCVAPPITFHDGLPAWSPPAGKPEGSIGYHRMYWFLEGESSSEWYLTPGFRVGLARPPLAVDVGLTSAVFESDGHFGALLGPAFAIGYQTQSASFLVRPGAYVLSITEEDIETGFDDPLWQVSVLGGNGYKAGRTHVSGGARIGRLGVGPVVLVGHSFGPVDLRLEGSYMFPRTDEAEGTLLSVGLTVGGPVPQGEDDSGRWE
jgi:hypothetical protein